MGLACKVIGCAPDGCDPDSDGIHCIECDADGPFDPRWIFWEDSLIGRLAATARRLKHRASLLFVGPRCGHCKTTLRFKPKYASPFGRFCSKKCDDATPF